ncbi:MAG: UDP-N-acetylmuramoyl-L-alanine--D-glutamate ligase [Myxococcota bacterium]
MEFEGQNVLVLGFGVSGRSAAKFCAERGARVVVADENRREPSEMDAAQMFAAAIRGDVELRIGRTFPNFADFDLVVPSPGIPEARWAGQAERVWGDIELCYRALQVPIIAVTGTNGKSTVVRLIEAMAQAAGLRAKAAGNLGIPALSLVGEPLDVAILEISSFQLESIDTFKPRTAVLLNISPDHLDRHGDLEGYRAAKAKIFARQTEGDSAILNGDDALTTSIELPAKTERLEFRHHLIGSAAGVSIEDAVVAAGVDGAWLDGRNAIVRRGGRQQSVSIETGTAAGTNPVDAAQPQQDENVLAALLALATLDADLEAATGALAEFRGLPHRCEPVAEVNGVLYVNDSKATNVGAAAQALSSFAQPIIWIAGGRHKGGPLESLAASAADRVKQALWIGEAANELESVIGGSLPTEHVRTLRNAIKRAAELAEPGDVVLLAPACASFDQFASFEDRGRQFTAAVKTLAAMKGNA